ncbi:NmrA family transcriptional regulator [Streptomyces venezuelae]|uniref:NmrA family transcriptional regulator n=1 Tax=Streptomyces venezuelae TaxID=54571 RepID=A0A5P2D2J5_STRVZ|nr:NAD(P)H-binding protein [Streptomyces venezuelae]QES48963.1 NmrA family transcriptional regulator [Streptomyces venezuelae]
MIVITGATGNVGRPLVTTLTAAGERVTAVSRTATGSPHHRVADLADPGTLRPVLDGADALYVIVAGCGQDLDPQGILDTAKAGGVRHVVLQSSQLTGTRPDSSSHAPLRAFEEAVRGSGLDWTVLHPAGFASNAGLWAEQVRARRTVAAPFGDVGLPVVDPADIAAVAATVLRDRRRHAGRTYVLTGPEAITPREQARALGEAVGEPVRFEELSREAARAQLLHVMPAVVAEGTLSVLGEPSAQEREVSPDVERLLGRPAGSFAGWAARNAAIFR